MEGTCWPTAYTHHALAVEVYGTNEPTAAQLSAVRRAVARLVAVGKAERAGRDWAQDPRDDHRGSHERVRAVGQYREPWAYRYRNPPGVTVHRALTDAERAAQAEALASLTTGTTADH